MSAKHLNLAVEKDVELPGGETMAFMLIPPREFSMGSGQIEREATVALMAADIENFVWIGATSKYKLQPINAKKTYAFGLHDMSGNPWEWCNGTQVN